MSINARFSAVDRYSTESSRAYSDISMLSDELQDENQRIGSEILRQKDAIERQLIRAKAISEELEGKISLLKSQIDEARSDMSYYRAREQYLLDNPTVYTRYDSDGDSYTVKEYDEAGISSARASYAEASSRCAMFEERLEIALAIRKDLSYLYEDMDILYQGISEALDAVEEDKRESKKYIRLMQDEMEHNRQSLYTIVKALEAYLSTKRIERPSVMYSSQMDRRG